MKHKIPERLTALLLSVVMFASLTTMAFAEEPVTVTLDKPELALTLDGSATLKATVANGAADASVTWTSDAPTVATVDAAGKVTAVAAGEAVVTATYTPAGGDPLGQPAASCTVTVLAPTVGFESELPVIAVGDTVKLNATVANGVQGGILAYAVDPLYASIVRVEGDVATALSAGTAVVKAIYTYTVGSDSAKRMAEASCELTVNALNVSATPVLVGLEVGQTKNLSGVTNSTSHTLTWASSKPAVATVDSHGQVKAIAPGITNVTAIVGGVSSSPVAVTVSGLALDKETIDMFLGKTAQLACTPFGNAADQTVLWSSSNMSVATVKNGRIAAHNVGTAVITATAGTYTVSCTVRVTEDVADDIPANVTLGQVLSFGGSLTEALQAAAVEQIGESLLYVSGLTVSPAQGVLYYAYSSANAPGQGVGNGENFYIGAVAGEKRLAQVSFVPNADFTGTAIIDYTGYGATASFTGKIRVAVSTSGDVSYNIPAGKGLLLTAEDFAVICYEKTGRSLRYVRFGLPDEDKGILYYNYSELEPYSLRVNETTKYYLTGGGMQLSRITFMPEENFTGVVNIPYFGTDTAGDTYAGTLAVMVYAGNVANMGGVAYQTTGGYAVQFDAADFNAACESAIQTTLHYIYIKQPDPEQGCLYYNFINEDHYGGIVSENDRYFRVSPTPLIGNISFMPAEGFEGLVTLPYVGYGVTGKNFEGTVTIRVSGSVGTVDYTTSKGRPVTFDGLDFNELCQAVSGMGLNYISFILPPVGQGTLYYNYRSTSTNNMKITSGGTYSVSTLSNITFVPAPSFSGVVSIPFSGYDNNGNRFTGAVKITVESQTIDDVIYYKALSGGTTHFNVDDFNDICRMLTGDNLDYVTFTAPSSGSLRYNGNTTYSYTFYMEAVTSGMRLLSNVSYQARTNYVGSATIRYTGRSTGGRDFSGTVKITVSAPKAEVLNYYGSSLPVKLGAADFEDACDSVMPQKLSYIRFDTLPEPSSGKLMLNYTQPNTGTEVKAAARYYANSAPSIDKLCFIAKADFRGPVIIPYAAVDTRGNEVQGTLIIHISDDNITKHFTDLRGHSWAVSSIEFVYNSGIMDGTGSGQFKPGNTVSRETFVGAVVRMLDFAPRRGQGFEDISEDNPYYTEIMTAQALGIAKGDGKKFMPEDVITREEAIAILVRAMKAANIKIESASVMLLEAYNDRAAVSSYATGDMASMIKMGIIKGDSAGNLNPQSLITRAEMAILIHRVLTL